MQINTPKHAYRGYDLSSVCEKALVLMDRTPVCTPTQVEILSVGCVVDPEFGFVRARIPFSSQASSTELSERCILRFYAG